MVKDSNRRVNIATSGRCNNNCLFCTDRDLDGGMFSLADRYSRLYGSFYLSIEGFKAKSNRPAGIHSILFTGGEPTLNSNLISLIRYAKKIGYRKIGIQTNGRLLRYNNLCVKLIESGVNEINISIHGSKKEIHDALTRAPGAFEQTFRGLSNLVDLKKRHKFKINTNFTITKLNYKDIYNYIKKFKSFEGIDSFILNTLMCAGNAKRFLSHLFVPCKDIAESVKTAINELKQGSVNQCLPVQISPMPFCLMLGYENYVGGFEEPFQIQNMKAKVLARNSLQIKRKECRLCKYFHKCNGVDSVYIKKIGWSEFKPVR